MKHAEVLLSGEIDNCDNYIEVKSPDGDGLFLTEKEYSQKELDIFESEKGKWILRCSGEKFFLADSDSGEDARGYYRGYFDLKPENAVFENGELVGIYICNDGIRYSGRGRYNFDVDDWGYPGYDPFDFVPYGGETHVFFFAKTDTHGWKDWKLLKREPEKEYRSYIDF